MGLRIAVGGLLFVCVAAVSCGGLPPPDALDFGGDRRDGDREPPVDMGLPDRDGGADRRDGNGAGDAADADIDAPDCEAACVGLCGKLPDSDCNCGNPCVGGQDCGANNRCACPASVPDQCDDTCVNLQNDAANCGSCGHDCLGGTCEEGRCQPVTIVEGQTNPTAIALNDTHVFWVNEVALSGSVVRAEKRPNATADPLATGQDTPVAIAVDDEGVYWCNRESSEIHRYRLDGSAVVDDYGEGENAPVAVATDATYVYWVNGPGNQVRRQDKAADFSPGILAPSPDASSPSSLAVAGNFVYWTNLGNQGQVMRRQISPAAIVPLAEQEGQPNSLLLDAAGTTLYWVNRDDGSVRTIPTAGGTAVSLAPAAGAYALAQDTDALYFVVRGNGTGRLMRLAKTSGAQPTELLGELADPVALAVDEEAVYFSERGSGAAAAGRIRRVAK